MQQWNRIRNHFMIVHIIVFQNERFCPISKIDHITVFIFKCCKIWFIEKIIGCTYLISLKFKI